MRNSNVLTTHSLKKLDIRDQTPAGEKLRVYELVLDQDSISDFGIHVPMCGLPKIVHKGASSAVQRNAQKIKNIKEALELEQGKGRVIAANIDVENLRNKAYVLVKQGNLINIMTRGDYDRIRKYGSLNIRALSIGEGSYEGEYDGNPYVLNGMGTLTFDNPSQTLKGLWIKDVIDQFYTKSEHKYSLHGTNFTGKISFSPFNEKSRLVFLNGKFTDRKGNYYEGEYNNALPNGRGKFVVNGVSFAGNVTTVAINQRNEHNRYTIKPDDPNADDVIFYQNDSSEIQIKERIPKPIPSLGETFQPVLTRALTLSQYLDSGRQTIIFIFNDTPYIMERSFYQSGWGSYHADPPSIICPRQYASFHHTRNSKTGGASQGFFSYQLKLPKAPLQVKCGFDTQVFSNNRFGGELLERCAAGELPDGTCDKGILTNKVEKKVHEATKQSSGSGIVMKLGMNNDHTSFFCVRLNQYDPNITQELNIPEEKAEVNEMKEGEKVNFFLKK